MRRLSLAFILALHLPASAGWLWLMPRGWPIASPRFWMNEVAPIAIFLVATTAIVALMMKRERLLLILAMPIASLWLAASVAALVVFPMSGWLITIRLFPLAALMLLAQLPFRKSLRRWQAFGVLVGIAIGAAMTFAERAPAPETRPLNLALAALPPDAKYEPTSIPVGEIAHLSARSGDVQIAGDGPLLVEISPLLTFISCSPDAGWVNFTLPIDRTRPHYALDRIARRGNSVMASYLPQAFLRVTPRDADNAVDIEADTPVTQPTYSHLNTFCELSVAGHKKLSISFSPCPDEKFEVTYYDYPFGRPATFACLGDDGIFRILRATSSEKGPFTTLGSGPLARGEPLTMTLFDTGVAFMRITLEDWSAQLSTQPSPTAGWKVPVNAIEFSLVTDRPSSPAGSYITLAATSVGRGFDSVGHAPGIYRNRMHVEQLQ
jgi:hypothetical protein